MPIYFHSLARKELLEAREYYDELVYGLGKKFIAEFEKSLNVIKINPQAYPVVNENIHRAVIIKFPYSILYRPEGEAIYILAIMHQKRKPNYWIKRETGQVGKA